MATFCAVVSQFANLMRWSGTTLGGWLGGKDDAPSNLDAAIPDKYLDSLQSCGTAPGVGCSTSPAGAGAQADFVLIVTAIETSTCSMIPIPQWVMFAFNLTMTIHVITMEYPKETAAGYFTSPTHHVRPETANLSYGALGTGFNGLCSAQRRALKEQCLLLFDCVVFLVLSGFS